MPTTAGSRALAATAFVPERDAPCLAGARAAGARIAGKAALAVTAGGRPRPGRRQYSGSYSGTFTLTWTQSGSNLHGTIHISNPAGTLPIHGTVSGSAIRFGTVGSMAITYSGTVSGSSMSGNYQVGGSAGGPWSAAKS